MDNLVLKIKYGGTLRRVTISKAMSFVELDKKIRDLFQLGGATPFVVTYLDNEGDIVTMADDQDLHDAVILQRLNPLRLTVKVDDESVSRSVSIPNSVHSAAETVSSAIPSETKAEERNEKSENTPPEVESKTEAESASGSQTTVDLEKIREDIESSLKTAWEVARGSEAEVKAALEPFLKVAPEKLAHVIESAMKNGFSATLEAVFDGPEPSSGVPRKETDPVKESAQPAVPESSKAENAPDAVPEASAQNAAKADEGSSSGEPKVDRVFHTGVQCDHCGVLPICGIRYKSTVKSDYDLCQKCYAEQGVEGEYNKIERPLYRRPMHPFWMAGGHPHGRMGVRGGCAPFAPGATPPSFGGRPFHMGRGGGCGRFADARLSEGKLDARFVKDVTIFDGTELAPRTPFTKIWRLRNNGTVPWPQHTRLVHVGGDHCGPDDFVAVQVPEDGLVPDAEVDVSVDLVAPEQPGRYVSHWRLMAPGGRKFGHRVWSLIQVVPQDEPSPQVAESVATAADEAPKDAEQHIPAAGSVPSAPPVPEEEIPVEVPVPAPVAAEPPAMLEEFLPAPVPTAEVPLAAEVEVPAPVATPESPKVEDTSVGGFSFVEHPSGDAVLGVATGAPVAPATEIPQEEPVQAKTEEKIPYPPVDVSVFVAGADEEEPVVVDAKVSAADAEMDSLLNQLYIMGFADRTLNADLLKENNMELSPTLDELVAISEWDPMMEELRELGFTDETMNRRLMRKNKGSVKHVVKDLVQMYKSGAHMSA